MIKFIRRVVVLSIDITVPYFYLGIFDRSDTRGPLKIAEVLDKSPLKKIKSQIRSGMKLAAVDGVKLDGKTNLASLLNHKSVTRGNMIKEG